MFLLVDRFGQTYTFDIPEGREDITSDIPPDDRVQLSEHKDEPEICLIEAVDAASNLLRCVFPEMEGHHLEIVCEYPEEDGTHKKDGGIVI